MARRKRNGDALISQVCASQCLLCGGGPDGFWQLHKAWRKTGAPCRAPPIDLLLAEGSAGFFGIMGDLGVADMTLVAYPD